MRFTLPSLTLVTLLTASAADAQTSQPLRSGDAKLGPAAPALMMSSVHTAAVRMPLLTTQEATLLPDGRIETRCGQVAADLRDFRFRAVGEHLPEVRREDQR